MPSHRARAEANIGKPFGFPDIRPRNFKISKFTGPVAVVSAVAVIVLLRKAVDPNVLHKRRTLTRKGHSRQLCEGYAIGLGFDGSTNPQKGISGCDWLRHILSVQGGITLMES